jgi:hypothetical protein
MLNINGREDLEITAIQPNAQIQASRFTRPAPPAPPVERPVSN